MSKKHVLFVITGLIMLLSITLITGFIGVKKSSNETEAGERAEVTAEQHPTTRVVTSEWKSKKADSDLVKLVNFLINNKGKEIELAGGKHKITGKEEIDVVVKVRACCKKFFKQGVDAVSAYGRIKNSSFEDASAHALIPAEKIPEMEVSFLIFRIYFEPKAKDYWMQVLK